MGMISAGIVGLVFILLIVFTVLSAKTWHWVNIVFVNLTFLAGLGAVVGLSQVFHLRYEAMKDLKNSEEILEMNQKAADLAVYGSPLSVSYERDSLRGIDQELSLEMTGRGRVWSGGQIAAAGENRKFQFGAARPAGEEGQVKLKDVLLYAFADGFIEGLPYPQSYIGSVMVTDESPTSLTLRPIFVADGEQWTKPSTSWSLFEKMPLDRHGTFKMGIVAAADSNPAASEKLKNFAASIRADEMEIAPFRDVLKSQYLKPDAFNLDPASAEYEKLIDRYAFDGMSLGKIQNWIEANPGNRVSQRFEPAPEEVFIRYKFNKKSSKSYKVDADGSLDTDGPFTQLGQAVDPALHAEKEVEFAEGDTVLVDQLTAEGYQRGTDLVPPFKQTEDVTEVDRIYVRQLRDYPYLLVDLNTQAIKFAEEAQRIREGIVIQDKSLADAEAQLQDRLTTTAGLEQDNTNLKNDLDSIEALHTAREEDVREIKARIVSLKDQIQKGYERIQELTRAIEGQAFAGS